MMMKPLLYMICCLGLAASFTACTNVQANQSTEFWVRGNCEMCKSKIEQTLEDSDGVAEAEYDLASNMVTIGFDSTLTSEKDLHKVVANVGYETKQAAADMGAYQLLPRCCLKKEDQ